MYVEDIFAKMDRKGEMGSSRQRMRGRSSTTIQAFSYFHHDVVVCPCNIGVIGLILEGKCAQISRLTPQKPRELITKHSPEIERVGISKCEEEILSNSMQI